MSRTGNSLALNMYYQPQTTPGLRPRHHRIPPPTPPLCILHAAARKKKKATTLILLLILIYDVIDNANKMMNKYTIII